MYPSFESNFSRLEILFFNVSICFCFSIKSASVSSFSKYISTLYFEFATLYLLIFKFSFDIFSLIIFIIYLTRVRICAILGPKEGKTWSFPVNVPCVGNICTWPGWRVPGARRSFLQMNRFCPTTTCPRKMRSFWRPFWFAVAAWRMCKRKWIFPIPLPRNGWRSCCCV